MYRSLVFFYNRINLAETTVIPRAGPVLQDLRPETVKAEQLKMKMEKSTTQILSQAAASRVAKLSRMKPTDESESDDSEDDDYLNQMRISMKKE